MIILIRGHIRNAFEDKKLYLFLKKVHRVIPNLVIYIHTWKVFSNSLSWRKIKENNEIVTVNTIYDYFADLKPMIKKIIIDDDTKINLIGNTTGKVSIGEMPTKGWKNYWYGKYKLINHVKTNETIINTRFDVLDNSNNFDESQLLQFIMTNNGKRFYKNAFLYDKKFCGLDNMYAGSLDTMYQLAKTFHYHLDNIVKKHETRFQEDLVYDVNNAIFHEPKKVQTLKMRIQ
jgi:hypothetical protein